MKHTNFFRYIYLALVCCLAAVLTSAQSPIVQTTDDMAHKTDHVTSQPISAFVWEQPGTPLESPEATQVADDQYYDLAGHKIPEPIHGITLVRHADGSVTKLVKQ